MILLDQSVYLVPSHTKRVEQVDPNAEMAGRKDQKQNYTSKRTGTVTHEQANETDEGMRCRYRDRWSSSGEQNEVMKQLGKHREQGRAHKADAD